MPKFNFNLRNPKSNLPTPIYLVIRYQKNRIVYPTGEKILPGQWDKKKQCKRYILYKPEMKFQELTPGQKKEYYSVRNFNSRLEEINSIALRTFNTYLKQNDQEEPEAKEYRLLLDVEFEKMAFARKDLFTYLRNFIDDRKRTGEESGNIMSRGASWRSYEQLFMHLTDYTMHIEAAVDFKDIDIDFYYYFADFLRNQKKLLPNTIGKHIKSLKSILNSATINGLNYNMIYKSKLFKVIAVKVRTLSLDESELDLIAALDLSDNKSLDLVRNVFILSAWTGLRSTEFSRIQRIDIEKKQIEIINQNKTNGITLPMRTDPKGILGKYASKTYNDLPIALSNANMNAYIKKLCKRIPKFSEPTEIDIDKKKKGERKVQSNAPKYDLITMQTARRSFYSNQYKRGIDIYLLMSVSSHKSQENFLKFIGVSNEEHTANMRKKWMEQLS